MDKLDLEDVVQVAEFRSELRRFVRRSERVARQHGLTPQRYLLLLMIKGAPNRKERSTVSELADRLQLAQHTVTELVSRAEQAGLVRRDQSGTDRRVTYVRLTPQGERKLTGSFNDLGPDRHSLQSLIAPKPR